MARSIYYGGPQPPNSRCALGFVRWRLVLYAIALGIQVFAFDLGIHLKATTGGSTRLVSNLHNKTVSLPQALIHHKSMVYSLYMVKCPGNERLKATTWGTKFCNTAPVVALTSISLAFGVCIRPWHSFFAFTLRPLLEVHKARQQPP